MKEIGLASKRAARIRNLFAASAIILSMMTSIAYTLRIHEDQTILSFINHLLELKIVYYPLLGIATIAGFAWPGMV